MLSSNNLVWKISPFGFLNRQLDFIDMHLRHHEGTNEKIFLVCLVASMIYIFFCTWSHGWLILPSFFHLDAKYAWNNAITDAYASNAGQCLYIVSLYPGLIRNNILNLFEENSYLRVWCIIDHHNYWAMTVYISLYPCKSSRKEELVLYST